MWIYVVSALIGWILYKELDDPYPNIPGPKGYPIIGNLIEVVMMAMNERYHELGQKYTAQYGSIFKMKVLGSYIFTVSDAEAMRLLLTETDQYWKDEMVRNSAIDIFPHALIAIPSGPEWKKHRKIVQPAFAPCFIQQTMDMTRKQVTEFCSLMVKLGGFSFDIAELTNVIALDIL